MKTSIKLFLFIIASSLAFAEDTKVEQTTTPPANYKDAFLGFALEKAKTYTGAAENAISKTVDVAMKEAPELAREYLTWKAWENGLKGSLGILEALIGGILLAVGIKEAKRIAWEYPPASLLIGAVLLMVGACLTPTWLGCIMDFIQIQIAPRIYIVEQLRQMIGK